MDNMDGMDIYSHADKVPNKYLFAPTLGQRVLRALYCAAGRVETYNPHKPQELDVVVTSWGLTGERELRPYRPGLEETTSIKTLNPKLELVADQSLALSGYRPPGVYKLTQSYIARKVMEFNNIKMTTEWTRFQWR